MTSLKEFLSFSPDDATKGVAQKNNLIKRNILSLVATSGECTIADLSKSLGISVPTVTKLVGELTEVGIVAERGKAETQGGRRPSVFGLADTGIFFAGAAIGREGISMVLCDLGNGIADSTFAPIRLEDTDQCFEAVADALAEFLAHSNRIMGIGVSIPGRVNPESGVSHRWFADPERPLRRRLEERLGLKVCLDNDTRAMCYAEYSATPAGAAQNMLYVNLGRGMAVGIVAGGQLYYGHSGFAGEFGHTPMFDNNVICSCGKRGCLETEVSAFAVENSMAALLESGVNSSLRPSYELTGTVRIDDIIDAARHDDTLSIELIEQVAEKAGKSIAVLLNIFNPELVVVGGSLARAGDHLMLPLLAATNKHSVGLVYNDTRFRPAQLDTNAGALGSAMMIRNEIIGLP